MPSVATKVIWATIPVLSFLLALGCSFLFTLGVAVGSE
jgi:hypothetical protein